MKRSLIAILLSLPFFLFAQKRQTVNFDRQANWSQLLEKARAEQRYIFIDVYATWCAPCKMMDAQVYTNDSVATFLNERFISVKMQMDSTRSDDGYIKAWRSMANEFRSQFQLNSLPAYLFFSPQGILILQDAGYKEPADFMAMAIQAADKQRLKYFQLLAAYKNDNRISVISGALAVFAKNVVHDYTTAGKIAAAYKSQFIDPEAPGQVIQKNKDFLLTFPYLITTKDPVFQGCYDRSALTDILIGQKGWAMQQVSDAICRDELDTKFYRDSKPVCPDPPFSELFSAVKQKYPKIELTPVLLNYQVAYYHTQKDWHKYALLKDEQLRKYPPGDQFAVFGMLNMDGAWDLFLNCRDRAILKKYGLKWIDQALMATNDIGLRAQLLDTKANLLYELGNKIAAIKIETEALQIARKLVKKTGRSEWTALNNEFTRVLKKMNGNEKTWQDN